MRNCLIVDDSSVVRKVARRILEDLDFTVIEAEDGAEALLFCRKAMPDLILLDSQMPEMDGMSVLEALRRQTAGGHKPKILFCATENDVAQIARVVRAGADDFLMKTFDRENVEAKLQEIGVI
jgi:two-component system chemotaxis response regulator CheY